MKVNCPISVASWQHVYLVSFGGISGLDHEEDFLDLLDDARTVQYELIQVGQ
jgi:hypothetical protein